MKINDLKQAITTPRAILLIASALYLAGKLSLLLAYHDIRWDEAVYLNMATYLYSAGEIGFWETLRPPFWPLLIGIGWLLGDAVLFGELVAAALGLAAALILYKTLTCANINKLVAASTAALLLATDIWFWGSSQLLTGVPSAALIIFAFYAHTKNRPYIAGILAATAFLTRFPAGMGFAALFFTHLALLWPQRKTLSKQALTPFAKLLGGFATLTVPWMLINTRLYAEYGLPAAIQPLREGSGNVFFFNTWLHNTDFWYYPEHFLTFLPVTLLALIGAWYVYKHKRLLPYALLAGMSILFFTALPNNQWRFALLILPGVLALTALGAQQLTTLHKHATTVLVALLLLNAGALAAYDHSLLSHRGPDAPPLEQDYYRFLDEHPVNGTIYVSDPVAAWHANNPATPIYYEFLLDVDELIQEEAAAVFFIPRSTPCPQADEQCKENVQRFADHLTQEYRLVHQTQLHNYTYFLFSNQINLAAQNSSAVYKEIAYVNNNPPR